MSKELNEIINEMVKERVGKHFNNDDEKIKDISEVIAFRFEKVFDEVCEHCNTVNSESNMFELVEYTTWYLNVVEYAFTAWELKSMINDSATERNFKDDSREIYTKLFKEEL